MWIVLEPKARTQWAENPAIRSVCIYNTGLVFRWEKAALADHFRSDKEQIILWEKHQ